MKQYTLTLAALLAAFMLTPAFAAPKNVTLEGKFMGANCMFFNKSCPHDMPDAHVAIEPDFVLTKPGGEYYYVLDLGRDIKARHLHENVRVKGVVNDEHSIRATHLEVKENGKYKTVWTREAELEERRKQLLRGN